MEKVLKTYEIYEIGNELNRLTVIGTSWMKAMMDAGIAKKDFRKWRIVGWGWVELPYELG